MRAGRSIAGLLGSWWTSFSAGEADESPFRVGPREDEEADEVTGTAPPKRGRTASPRTAQERSDVDTSSHASLVDIEIFEMGLGHPRNL